MSNGAIDNKGLTDGCNDYMEIMLISGIPTIVREKFPYVVKEYEGLVMDDHAVILDVTHKDGELVSVTIHHYLTCKTCLKSRDDK